MFTPALKFHPFLLEILSSQTRDNNVTCKCVVVKYRHDLQEIVIMIIANYLQKLWLQK